MQNMSDKRLLGRLLSADLDSKERDAFTDMLARLEMSRKPSLSAPQRAWAEKVYDKLDLDSEEGCANLVSSGAYTPTAEERKPRYPWELSENRPLKPPGRH